MPKITEKKIFSNPENVVLDHFHGALIALKIWIPEFWWLP